MRKPWKKIKSKIVHKNPWYQVREDDVIRPDGKKGKYFVVDGINSVGVIAEDKDGKIYLVGQSRYPVGNIYSWEIVSGCFKTGADPLKTAKRELEEEAGVKAKKWIYLGYCHPVNGWGSEVSHVFYAKDLTFGKMNLEGTEDITVKKKSLEEILKMIKKNEITCGLTTSAICKLLIYSGRYARYIK